jgi:two-component system cell cycle sensor histidine kinase/response regulator CckA
MSDLTSQPSPPSQANPPSQPNQPCRVLMIDDDEDDYVLTRDLVSQIRLPGKAALQWAPTYEAGLLALGRQAPDVCLIDYRLGARDGIELLTEARSRGCVSPIIVLTGKGDVETDSLAMARGADDYLVKGDLTVALLERSVRYVLDRARQVEALRASEQRYKTLFETSSEGILIADVETRAIRYANPAASAMFGYTTAELCAMHAGDLSPKASMKDSLAAFEAVGHGTQSRLVDQPRRRKDGAIILTDISTGRVLGGDRTLVAAFYRDVTERTAAERALKASEARYRRLFEAAKDGILILDADSGRIVDVNPFMVGLMGYSRDELLGCHLWEIGPLKDVPASKALFAELQAQDYVRYEDLPLATRAGRLVDVEFISNAYLVDDRKVIQCNVRDITAHKRADAVNVRLATAIEQATETVVVTDAHGDIEYVNPAFEAGTGYSRAEAIGHNPRLLSSGAQDRAFYEVLWATISSGEPWRGRMVNRKKDGTLYTEDATISPVRDTAGAITAYVAVKRDVTASLAMEAQLLQSQKMEAVGRLAGGIAHDFNNLLSVILSYGEMLLGDMAEADPMREDMEEIRKAANRAANLTRQLLMFSRQQVVAPKIVDLNEVLTGVDKMLQRILGADVELVARPAPALGRVFVDPTGMEQVIVNLVVNAHDAMPTGGQLTMETANVELDEAYARAHLGVKAGPHVMLAVTDTGSGMDAVTLGRVFEPFFTTKEKGKGTGLGLSTVFGIVQQSGGSVWVYSELGKGTAFKIYLPRVDSAAASAGAAESNWPRPSRPGTETVLLVEDDDQVRAVALGILRRNGYVVLEARNGAEALGQSEQYDGTIHLLLSDIVMPGMSGAELARCLAKARPDMKVLCMSGYTDDTVVRHGVLEADIAFIQKPITPAALAAKVREVLDS